MRLLIALLLTSLGLASAGARAAEAVSADAPAAAVTNVPAPPLTGFESQVLSPLDKLAYRVLEDPVKGVPEVVSVTALFELHFPVSRGAAEMISIGVRGKTLAQVRQELKAALDADYYRNANVDLKLLDRSQKGGQILLFGQVRAYSIPLAPGEQLTLLAGVLQAQPTEWANLKKVELQRIDPATQKPTSRIIDVDAIKNGNRENDVLLQDGDRIKVPEVKFKIF